MVDTYQGMDSSTEGKVNCEFVEPASGGSEKMEWMDELLSNLDATSQQGG